MIPKDEIGGVKEIKSDVTSIIEDKEKKGEEISLAELFKDMIHRENHYLEHRMRIEAMLDQLEEK